MPKETHAYYLIKHASSSYYTLVNLSIDLRQDQHMHFNYCPRVFKVI